MARRLTLLVVLLLVLPATAFAATVKVRVEGKTRTLFGPTEVTVTAATPLDAIAAGVASRRALLPRHHDQLRPVRRPGRPLRRRRVERLGVQGRQRLAARRRRQGAVEGRRPRALVLRDVRPDRRPADARGEGGDEEGLLHGDRVRRQRQAGRRVAGLAWHVGSKKSVAAMSGAAFCPGKHTGLLIRATATGAVRSNAVA